MKKIYRNGLLMLAAGAFAVSCADYNTLDDFTAEPDPTVKEPYKDLDVVKSYIDYEKHPNMTLDATLKVADFNKQELAHAAAVSNFNNVAFGSTLMSGSIVNAKGVMNFINMKDLLDHMQEIGSDVFGSPIVANANQADDWLNTLTAPVEISVQSVPVKTVDFTTMTKFEGTIVKGDATKTKITKYGGSNALMIGTGNKVRIIEDFEVDPTAKYTSTLWAKADKDATFNVVFSGKDVPGAATGGKWTFKAGKQVKIMIESQADPNVTSGYLQINNALSAAIYIDSVEVVYTPDNHREMTAQEKNDTINYALNKWCDGLMEINAGRITSFDLIEEPLDVNAELENGMYDLKHSTEKIFWQDIIGSEQYAPKVSKVASEAFAKYEGDPSQLKFFISESGLQEAKKFESLKYWMDIWDRNGAKIDGVNAKLKLEYNEDADKLAANKEAYETLLRNLVATGKLVRLSDFDIKYINSKNLNVTAKDITEEQRQTLADFNAYAIKAYLDIVPDNQQAGICKGNISDTSDPVGLWSVDNKSGWVRTATYKAFCDALSGK